MEQLCWLLTFEGRGENLFFDPERKVPNRLSSCHLGITRAFMSARQSSKSRFINVVDELGSILQQACVRRA